MSMPQLAEKTGAVGGDDHARSRLRSTMSHAARSQQHEVVAGLADLEDDLAPGVGPLGTPFLPALQRPLRRASGTPGVRARSWARGWRPFARGLRSWVRLRGASPGRRPGRPGCGSGPVRPPVSSRAWPSGVTRRAGMIRGSRWTRGSCGRCRWWCRRGTRRRAWGRLVEEVEAGVLGVGIDAELIVVDDGLGGPELGAAGAAGGDAAVAAAGAAVAGARAIRGAGRGHRPRAWAGAVATLDADGQNDPAELPRLLALLQTSGGRARAGRPRGPAGPVEPAGRERRRPGGAAVAARRPDA